MAHNHTSYSRRSSRREPMAGPHYSPSPSPPLSPPPLNLVGSPYWRAPLPPVSEPDFFPHPSSPHHHHYQHQQATPLLHPLLRYSFTPVINYDLSHHPSTITAVQDRRPLPIITLVEPATNPPLPSLTIVIPQLPWPITVSARKPNRFVTVADVFSALHHSLSQPAPPSEYPSPPSPLSPLSPSSGALFRAHAACDFDSRLPATPHWQAYGRPTMRRVDLLRGRTRFMGLSTMGRDPTTWVLSTF